MKSREVVTKDNYKQIVLKRMIILCWILLAVCFVVKIFGGNFFNIVCQNERFIKVCEYVDENVWLQYVIGCISTLICQYLYIFTILATIKPNKFETLIVITSTIIGVCLRLISSYIGFIVDLWQFVLMPLVLNFKYINIRYICRIIFVFLLTLVFQIVSMITKNLSFGFVMDSFLLGIIYSIDVYIMTILMYLYINKSKGSNNMGLIMQWLWGKSPKTLQKMKATRLEKRAKLDQEIAEINSELDRQKNENK
jgi:hypothetical protein